MSIMKLTRFLKRKRRSGKRKEGVALVTTLAVIGLVFMLVMAYVAVTRSDRISSSVYGQSIRADELGKGALDRLIASLQAEIQSGSIDDPAYKEDGRNREIWVYRPEDPAAMLPARFVDNGEKSPADPSDPDDFHALVRRSMRKSHITEWKPEHMTSYQDSNFVEDLTAVGVSTDEKSLRGRFISKRRWNLPKFIPEDAADSRFVAPDWVLVSRTGTVNGGSKGEKGILDHARNASPDNEDYIVGRYAYTIYDVGGLMDVNVVGHPSGSVDETGDDANKLLPSDLDRKGSLMMVDLPKFLTKVTAKSDNPLSPAQAQNVADDLTQWRHRKFTDNGFQGFRDFILSGWVGSGYMGQGQQAFLGRQDLLEFAAEREIPDSALEYLTVFTREKNAPSWKPTLSEDARRMTENEGGGRYKYEDTEVANDRDTRNRDLANVRVEKDSTGTSRGKPLLRQRFDLNRLAWLTYKGPSAELSESDPLYNKYGTRKNIKKHFGLVWDNHSFDYDDQSGQQWVYVSPDAPDNFNHPLMAADIKTLGEVAQIADTDTGRSRSPDFFELLQATILEGSLALYDKNQMDRANTNEQTVSQANNATDITMDLLTDGNKLLVDAQVKYHVMRIGANIIDQYDMDSFPTAIRFNSAYGKDTTHARSFDLYWGTEDIPCLANQAIFMYRPDPSADPEMSLINISTHKIRDAIGFYDTFSFWNPHQNASPNWDLLVFKQGTQINLQDLRPVEYRVIPTHGKTQPMLIYGGGAISSQSMPWEGQYGRNFDKFAGAGIEQITDTQVPLWIGASSTTTVTWDVYPSEAYIAFKESQEKFFDPTLLSKKTVTLNYDSGSFGKQVGSVSDGKVDFEGILLGAQSRLDSDAANVMKPWGPLQWAQLQTQNPASYAGRYNNTRGYFRAFQGVGPPFHYLDLEVQYRIPGESGNHWRTYQKFTSIAYDGLRGEEGHGHEGRTAGQHFIRDPSDSLHYATLDPRTNRLGLRMHFGDSGFVPPNKAAFGWDAQLPDGRRGMELSFRPTKDIEIAAVIPTLDSVPSGPKFVNALGRKKVDTSLDESGAPIDVQLVGHMPNNLLPEDLSTDENPFYYQDSDGVVRPGDAGGRLDANGQPIIPNALVWNGLSRSQTLDNVAESRPLILNRPFQSVAELGYVFRDVPWKSLDFTSSVSADSGLLDVFYLGAGLPEEEEPPVVAGKVNLNAASQPVLEALLEGTGRVPDDFIEISKSLSADPDRQRVTEEQADAIASSFKDFLTSNQYGLLTDKGELVTGFSQYIENDIGKTGTSPEFPGIKAHREAHVRALADVGQVRTWNLMIDLIVQTGRYPAVAKNLKDFMVEGERRYWLHLAIDRFTGEIVDQQLERVYE